MPKACYVHFGGMQFSFVLMRFQIRRMHGFADHLHRLEGSHSVEVTWQEFRHTEQFF